MYTTTKSSLSIDKKCANPAAPASTNRLFVMFILFISTFEAAARSFHRPPDERMPELSLRWSGTQDPIFKIASWTIRPHALFHAFDPMHVEKNYVPDHISSRNNPKKRISSQPIKDIITTITKQLLAGNRDHEVFQKIKILKDSDFSKETQSGLIVFKLNDHPFVVKLFLESPQSLIKPHKKGVIQYGIFIMSGGGGRHISGLARIKNRNAIAEMLHENPFWRSRITLPRKWFYIPPQSRMIEICGKNIGPHSNSCTRIPSIYAIICDEIQGEPLSLANANNRRLILALVKDSKSRLDPFVKNYMREKNGAICIIDTEHFPSSMGIKRGQDLASYTGWYTSLALRYLYNAYGISKRARLKSVWEDGPPKP